MNCCVCVDFTTPCDEDAKAAAEIEIQQDGISLDQLDAKCNAKCLNELKLNGFCEYEMDRCVCGKQLQ